MDDAETAAERLKQQHESPEAYLTRVAKRGCVTTRQAHAAGLSDQAIARRVRAKRLFPRYQGVFGLAKDLPPYGCEQAALLASRGALVDVSGGFVFGLVPYSSWPVHVSKGNVVLRPRRGLVPHRRPHLETRTKHGLLVATPAHVLIDLAARGDQPLELQVADALRRGLCTLEDLAAAMAVRAGGVAAMREVLREEPVYIRSQAEALMLRVARAAGMPPPIVNRVGPTGRELDFSWPQYGLIVEVDAYSTHGDPIAFEADRLRDQELRLAGENPPVRITYPQLLRTPGWVMGLLRALGPDRVRP